MKVLNDFVLIKPIQSIQQKTASGLLLQEETSIDNKGQVVGIGPGTLSMYTGVTYPVDGIKVGDLVIFRR